MQENKKAACLIIGASHAGVNAAFALRKEGWEGEILLLDQEPHLPYHRPPLSKKYMTEEAGIEKYALKPRSSYEKSDIQLRMGKKATQIKPDQKQVILEDGKKLRYDKLILATGGKPFVPPISGLKETANVFTLRKAQDVQQILDALSKTNKQRVAIIGGGFIGLEIAASLSKMGAKVSLLEREKRLLSRVTSEAISNWFQHIHQNHGVEVLLGKELGEVKADANALELSCSDGTKLGADLVVVGVGIRPDTRLAEEAGLEVGNGIHTNAFMQTSEKDIYAIGDCTWHKNVAYETKMRLESVQNAVEQGKVAAAHIAGKERPLNNIPWFWSDQYDAKLQMVGLPDGYDDLIVRKEKSPDSISVWFFKGEKPIAVHAINHPKAYILGMRFVKQGDPLDKAKLQNPDEELKPDKLLA